MKINSIKKTSFKSKASPIAPFTIRTKRGRLNVAEVTRRDINRNEFFLHLTRFFCKNFASLTKDPNWKVFTNRSSINYENAIQEFIRYYLSRIKSKDSDMTLLLAKDKRNKIQGACLAYGYDRIPGVKNKVCYIDSLAVNQSYRGFSVGKLLLQKTLDSARNCFSDAFLAGDRLASGFYEKMGFVPLDRNEEEQKALIDFISRRRSDYPEYIEFYNLPLRKEKNRWYENVSEIIR